MFVNLIYQVITMGLNRAGTLFEIQNLDSLKFSSSFFWVPPHWWSMRQEKTPGFRISTS